MKIKTKIGYYIGLIIRYVVGTPAVILTKLLRKINNRGN